MNVCESSSEKHEQQWKYVGRAQILEESGPV